MKKVPWRLTAVAKKEGAVRPDSLQQATAEKPTAPGSNKKDPFPVERKKAKADHVGPPLEGDLLVKVTATGRTPAN